MGCPGSAGVGIRFEAAGESRDQLYAEIRTKDLTLRSVQRKDLVVYVDLFRDINTLLNYPEYTQRYIGEKPELWMKKQKESTTKRVDEYIKRWKEDDPFGAFAIFKGPEAKWDQFIGHVVVTFGDNEDKSEAPLVIKKEEWNKGYSRQVAEALCAYYETIQDLHKSIDYEIKNKNPLAPWQISPAPTTSKPSMSSIPSS